MEGNFKLRGWLVEPALNTVSRNGTSVHLTPKVMGVLVCLAQRAGEPVSKETLLRTVWPDTFVGDDVLKVSISELRRVMQDDAREPTIIQTIPKRGYRLVVPVEPVNGVGDARAVQRRQRGLRITAPRTGALRVALLATAGVTLLLGLLVALNVGGVRRWLKAGVSPEIHSLAVLPLRNLSSDPNEEYFSDGLTDELITNLAQIGSLRVISHTSTMQYKDAKKPLPEIARELNVDGIIEGTVQRSGDRVRITAQLIHGPSDKHIWASSYERDLRDVFALERDVTEEISRQVQARLVTQSQVPRAQPRPVNPKALDAYLEGSYHLSRYGEGFGEEEQEKAAQYFQRAIDDDANFAPAYNGLASAHGQLIRGSNQDVAIARKAAEKAVALDPNYADARVTLGFLDWQPDLNWRGAEEQFRAAITLSPNNADAHGILGLLLVTLGRVEEGLQESQIAQQLDPNSDHLSLQLYHAHDYDASIERIQWMLRKDPNNGVAHCLLFDDYLEKQSYREAIDELVECSSLYGYTKIASSLRRAFAISGYRGAIRQWANEVEHLQTTNQVYWPGSLATAYTILGDKDRAFYWLEQAYEHRELVSLDAGIFFLKSEPTYDPLSSDPRFNDLLRRIGLPP